MVVYFLIIGIYCLLCGMWVLGLTYIFIYLLSILLYFVIGFLIIISAGKPLGRGRIGASWFYITLYLLSVAPTVICIIHVVCLFPLTSLYVFCVFCWIIYSYLCI